MNHTRTIWIMALLLIASTVTVLLAGSGSHNAAGQESTGVVEVHVLNFTSKAGVAGATVTYSGGSNTTDEDGTAFFYDVEYGDVEFTAEADGYRDQSKTITTEQRFKFGYSQDYYNSPFNILQSYITTWQDANLGFNGFDVPNSLFGTHFESTGLTYMGHIMPYQEAITGPQSQSYKDFIVTIQE